VQFTAFYNIQLPSKTVLRSHVLLPGFCDKIMEQNYEDCTTKNPVETQVPHNYHC